MSRQLSRGGVAVELPDGWEGRIFQRTADRGLASPQVMHVASFAIPAEVGDFGGGAVELMSNRDVLIVLFEYGRDSAVQPLFSEQGVPRVRPDDVSPSQLRQTLEGQGGVQEFFSQSGRAFCLYVVFGSYLRRIRTIPIVNSILDSLTIV
jgi:hypothetical protein